MIEQTVEDLTTIIGTRPGMPRAGRVAGNDLPSPSAAGAAPGTPAGTVAKGAVAVRARRRPRRAA